MGATAMRRLSAIALFFAIVVMPSQSLGAKTIEYVKSNEIVGIFKQYEGTSLYRGQYETKSEFDKRVNEIKATQQKTFAVQLPVVARRSHYIYSMRYDIDSQSYKYNKSGKFSDVRTSMNIGSIDNFTFIADIKKTGSYIAENQFGVKKEVIHEEYIDYSISPANHNGLNELIKKDNLLLEYKCDRDTAKELGDNVILVIEFAPVMLGDEKFQRYIVSDSTTKPPTMSSPVERKSNYRYIFANILAFHFVNQQTEEILKTIRISSHKGDALPKKSRPGTS